MVFMDMLVKYIPILLPLVLLEVIIMLFALVHIIRHPNVKRGNRVVWILLILFVQFAGPILYFLIGKGDE